MKADIFLSYANEDESRVQPLIRALEQSGFSVWWDRQVAPGRTFAEVIEEAITAARCVVVAWTKASVQSKWVNREAREGERRGVLIPVLLDNVTIPFEFRDIEAANLVNWNGDTADAEFSSIVASIQSTPSPRRATVDGADGNRLPEYNLFVLFTYLCWVAGFSLTCVGYLQDALPMAILGPAIVAVGVVVKLALKR